jgi:signal transduction histidine kinase
MEWWHVAAVANSVIMLAYLGISAAILLPLIEAGEVRTNRLGLATAFIFFSCAVGHGGHAFHVLAPLVGIGEAHGEVARSAIDWHLALWDSLTACIGLWYWTLRRSYGRLLEGAKLFEDLRERQREAAEINDSVVQGIVAAQLARRLGRDDEADAALAGTLVASRELVSRLLLEASSGRPQDAGDFVRTSPAQVTAPPPQRAPADDAPAPDPTSGPAT